MEILDVLQIILNGKFLLDDDRIFVEKCVRNRSIIDLDRICDIISNYFIHVRTKILIMFVEMYVLICYHL